MAALLTGKNVALLVTDVFGRGELPKLQTRHGEYGYGGDPQWRSGTYLDSHLADGERPIDPPGPQQPPLKPPKPGERPPSPPPHKAPPEQPPSTPPPGTPDKPEPPKPPPHGFVSPTG
jgi:hypothetical protein